MREQLCEDMQVVVLMGGLGTRLGADIPKSMVDVRGVPFFHYQFDIMRGAGFRKFVFCVGKGAEEIEEYFGDGSDFNVEIVYSYDGDHLLGTGGAVRKALPLLEQNFMLIYGDSFMDVNYFDIIVKYLQSECWSLMTIMKNNNKYDVSNIECNNGIILDYSKDKPSLFMEYIDYGISIFNRSIFSAWPPDTKFDLSEVFTFLVKNHELASHIVGRRFYEIGTPAALQEFKDYANNRWYTLHKAIFLDRDGVINEPAWNEDYEQLDSPFNKSQVKLKPNIVEGLRVLQEDHLLFIVTNQPAAAKGKTSYEQLCTVNQYIIDQLAAEDIYITDYRICPHYEHDTPYTAEPYLIRNCGCRKPKPGMIIDIVNNYAIDIENSWMVGDFVNDILCGIISGLKTAFIGEYKCDTCAALKYQKPDLICADLNEFAEELLQ